MKIFNPENDKMVPEILGTTETPQQPTKIAKSIKTPKCTDFVRILEDKKKSRNGSARMLVLSLDTHLQALSVEERESFVDYVIQKVTDLNKRHVVKKSINEVVQNILAEVK